MNHFFASQVAGWLDCTDSIQPSIVPFTYAFDGAAIYAQTNEQMKWSLFRNNPYVYFQVDMMTAMANCQSLVVRGRFEELKTNAAAKARLVLYNRVFPFMTSATLHQNKYGENIELDDANRLNPV